MSAYDPAYTPTTVAEADVYWGFRYRGTAMGLWWRKSAARTRHAARGRGRLAVSERLIGLIDKSLPVDEADSVSFKCSIRRLASGNETTQNVSTGFAD